MNRDTWSVIVFNQTIDGLESITNHVSRITFVCHLSSFVESNSCIRVKHL
jgi:hypothetical protein